MNNEALLLSLGHNSSAIHTNGRTHVGYEEERIDRIKSSSASPLRALQEISKHRSVKNVPMYATHWFDSFSGLLEVKYNLGLSAYCKENGNRLVTHTSDFTHHDAHALSALSFYRHYLKADQLKLDKFSSYANEPLHIIVADGFGNFQEVFSIYEGNANGKYLSLRRKSYGFENSLGLMYQYATDFCGMKMNQDEYKFLGYESKLQSYFSFAEIEKLDSESSIQAGHMIVKLSKCTQKPDSTGELIDFAKLKHVKQEWNGVFVRLLSGTLGLLEFQDSKARVAIAYFIQSVVEKVLIATIKMLKIKNLAVAGGLFYNVKLNNAMLSTVPGLFSVVPVTGDQGASIGFYEKYVGEFNWDTLCIGNRSLDMDVWKDLAKGKNSRIYVVDSPQLLVELLAEKIDNGEICNLVTDKMEYGPRALGATSSLFLPSERNSEFNNKLNQRNEVMPFAPMITEGAMDNMFGQLFRRVVGSDRFMVVTYEYTEARTLENAGVFHKHPMGHFYTGRPQVIHYDKNPVLHRVISEVTDCGNPPMITNTSYNYHGEPIVFSTEDIFKTHARQLANRDSYDFTSPNVNLIIYNSKESA